MALFVSVSLTLEVPWGQCDVAWIGVAPAVGLCNTNLSVGRRHEWDSWVSDKGCWLMAWPTV
jgi:hypothetical protein